MTKNIENSLKPPQQYATGCAGLIIRLIAAGKADLDEASLRPELEKAFPEHNWSYAKWDRHHLYQLCYRFLTRTKHDLDPSVVKAYKQTFEGQKDLNLVKAHKSDNTRIKDEWCAAERYRLKQERIRSGEKIDRGRLAALVADNWLNSDVALRMHGAHGVKKRIRDADKRRSKTRYKYHNKKAEIATAKAAKAAALEEEVAEMSDY